MALLCLIPSLEWDSPFFKVLANTDTGNAPGKSGGVLIPKDLRSYFPALEGNVTADEPTIDQRVTATLYDGNKFLGVVDTRYQLQTWGGSRSPEFRLTGNLGALRDLARGGDILLIQRSTQNPLHFRLTLVQQVNPECIRVSDRIGTRSCGALTDDIPITDTDLQDARREAIQEEEFRENSEFKLVDEDAATNETLVSKIARSEAFRASILRIYNESCAFCGEALRSPSGAVEIDAAHIYPRSAMGADDARNGLALCKKHHWAFDKGMIGVDEDRKIMIPASVLEESSNSGLEALNGESIREANKDSLKAHDEAFAWHRDMILIQS